MVGFSTYITFSLVKRYIMNYKKTFHHSRAKELLSYLAIASFLLTSCKAFAVERHRPSTLSLAFYVFKDDNDNYYFTLRDSRLFVYNHDGNFHHYEEVNSKIRGEKGFNPYGATANSNHLFISEYSTYSNSNITKIEVFDKTLALINSFVLDQTISGVLHMECSEKYLYFVSRVQKSNTYSLFRLDYFNNEITELLANAEKDTSYVDEDIHLFFYSPYIFEKHSVKTKMIQVKEKSKTRIFTDTVELLFSKSGLEVTNQGSVSSFAFDYDINNFYPSFLINDRVLFAGYNYKADSKCLAKDYDVSCICGLRESYLFSFDLTTNNLSLLGEYPNGTYLIDYDLTTVAYYRDGGLYINDQLRQDCTKITAGELERFNIFDASYNDTMTKEQYYLCFHDNVFFGF